MVESGFDEASLAARLANKSMESGETCQKAHRTIPFAMSPKNSKCQPFISFSTRELE